MRGVKNVDYVAFLCPNMSSVNNLVFSRDNWCMGIGILSKSEIYWGILANYPSQVYKSNYKKKTISKIVDTFQIVMKHFSGYFQLLWCSFLKLLCILKNPPMLCILGLVRDGHYHSLAPTLHESKCILSLSCEIREMVQCQPSLQRKSKPQ